MVELTRGRAPAVPLSTLDDRHDLWPCCRSGREAKSAPSSRAFYDILWLMGNKAACCDSCSDCPRAATLNLIAALNFGLGPHLLFGIVTTINHSNGNRAKCQPPG